MYIHWSIRIMDTFWISHFNSPIFGGFTGIYAIPAKFLDDELGTLFLALFFLAVVRLRSIVDISACISALCTPYHTDKHTYWWINGWGFRSPKALEPSLLTGATPLPLPPLPLLAGVVWCHMTLPADTARCQSCPACRRCCNGGHGRDGFRVLSQTTSRGYVCTMN